MDFILFTDSWWNWFLHEYAFSIGVIWALLKMLAILHPGVETNKIMELLATTFKRTEK